MFKSKKVHRAYSIENFNDSIIIKIIDDVTIKNAYLFHINLKEFSKDSPITLDLSGTFKYDSYIIIFINNFKNIAKLNNADFQIINITQELEQFINILRIDEQKINSEQHSFLYNKIAEIGENIQNLGKETYEYISFFGQVIIKLLASVIKPSKIRWTDFPDLFVRNGVLALPITILIVFLIGLISGYQGALQLKQFGADIFIADLVGISITRELSPLMVAILVAGRSGSSFAAQLGTMKVTEEIDALETMGFDRFNFLILPRIISVTLAMPILVLICNVVGIGGGLIAALSTLDVTLIGYVNRLQEAISLGDIFSGLIKSLVFGFLIATIGCYKGLSAKGGADSVGRITTGSVVAGVFVIILVDAVFTFLLTALGL